VHKNKVGVCLGRAETQRCLHLLHCGPSWETAHPLLALAASHDPLFRLTEALLGAHGARMGMGGPKGGKGGFGHSRAGLCELTHTHTPPRSTNLEVAAQVVLEPNEARLPPWMPRHGCLGLHHTVWGLPAVQSRPKRAVVRLQGVHGHGCPVLSHDPPTMHTHPVPCMLEPGRTRCHTRDAPPRVPPPPPPGRELMGALSQPKAQWVRYLLRHVSVVRRQK
jgi:hypothetical protein